MSSSLDKYSDKISQEEVAFLCVLGVSAVSYGFGCSALEFPSSRD
jgi:hypothetical protein